MPCSPLCTSYLWVEFEGRTFTLITFRGERVKASPWIPCIWCRWGWLFRKSSAVKIKMLANIAVMSSSLTTILCTFLTQGYKQQHAFIVTQYPLASTVTDFWRMLCEQESCCVVSLHSNDEVNWNTEWIVSTESWCGYVKHGEELLSWRFECWPLFFCFFSFFTVFNIPTSTFSWYNSLFYSLRRLRSTLVLTGTSIKDYRMV